MIITHKMEIDLTMPRNQPPVRVMQGDQNSRRIAVTLTNGGEAWVVPTGTKVRVGYQRMDGTKGAYDTMPDGAAAGRIANNVVTVAIAPQVLTEVGRVRLSVSLESGDTVVSTFPVDLQVGALPGYEAELDELPGGDCQRMHVVLVDELPAENVEEGAVYRVTGQEFTAVAFRDGDEFCGDIVADLGASCSYHIVQELPTENIVAMAIYYVESENEIYLSDDGESFISGAEMFEGLTCKGVISDGSQATEDGYYAVFGEVTSFHQYSKANAGFSDLVLEGESLATLAPVYGLTASFNHVATKPTEGILESDTSNGIWHCYYVEDEENVFLYANGEWATAADLFGTAYMGTVNRTAEATAEGIYAVISDGWTDYICPSGTMSITENGGPYDVTDQASVVVDVPVPDGYIMPSGTATITENGTHDVTAYDSAEVNVPVPDGYIQPNGTKEITANGEHDVTEYASVNVAIPENEPVLQEKTVTENGEVVADDGYDGLSKVTVNVESGLAINGIIEQYKVNTGATVNAGDFVEFVNKFGSGVFCDDKPIYVSACKLDSSRVLVAYRIDDDARYGKACVVTVDGGLCLVGESAVFNEASTFRLSATALDDSRVVVAYEDASEKYYAKAVVLTVNDTVITVGTPKTVNEADTNYISVTKLTNEKVIMVYDSADSNTCKCNVVTVTGSTLSIGAKLTFDSSKGRHFRVVPISTILVVVTYYALSEVGDDYPEFVRSIPISINGTSCTKHSCIDIKYDGTTSVTVDSLFAVALNDSKVLAAFRWGDMTIAKLITRSDYSLSAGDDVVIFDAPVTNLSAVTLSESKVLVTYTDIVDQDDGKAVVLTVDGDTITKGAATAFDNGMASYFSSVKMSDDAVLVAYNNGAGVYTQLAVDDVTTTNDSVVGTFVQPATSRLNSMGVAATGGAEGETVDVYVVG